MSNVTLLEDVTLIKKDISVFCVKEAGPYFLTEKSAQENGATHRKCECGEIVRKHSPCSKCWAKKQAARFESFEIVPLSFPCVVFNSEDWFFDLESLSEYLLEFEEDISEVKLCATKKMSPPQVDFDDLIEDYIPSDHDSDIYASEQIDLLISTLNKELKGMPPVYEQDDKRIDIRSVV